MQMILLISVSFVHTCWNLSIPALDMENVAVLDLFYFSLFPWLFACLLFFIMLVFLVYYPSKMQNDVFGN
jgi:hypothetical protein